MATTRNRPRHSSSIAPSWLLDVFVAKYPALLDTEGEIAVHYRIPGMPTTFFIDADGIVRSMGAGLIVEEVLVEELARIGVTYEPEDP